MTVTVLAVVCLLALMMWRPVVEMVEAARRLDEWAAEQAAEARRKRPMPPGWHRAGDDDDQGYVY